MNLLQDYSIDGGFLQSVEWRKFKKNNNLNVFFIGNNKNFNASIIEHKLPFNIKYFFVPRGPIFKTEFNIKDYCIEIINLARKNNISWIRIEPQTFEDLEKIKKSFNDFKIVKSVVGHEPPQTLMIDLEKTEEDILLNMKKKTRYNIKLSQKKGVVFSVSRKKTDIKDFLNLMDTTATRNKIKNHKKEYYQKIFDNFDDKTVRLYIATYQGKIVAGIVSIFFGDIVTSLYGASDKKYHNLKSPYGLRWKIISDAKQEGYKKHDLGGVKITKDKDGKNISAPGKWSGFSETKLGFCYNSDPINFPCCYDIVLNPYKYYFYIIIHKIKKYIKI